MKILLTGAEGYIGSMLGPHLVGCGHEVEGIDAGYFREAAFVEEPVGVPPVRRADTRDLTPSDLLGFDAVVHLAELSNDPLGQLRPEVTREINCEASVKLARAAKEAGVRRFVYSSSCSVYGAGGDEVKTEESEPRPQTVYAECKLRVERALREMADDRFCPVLLRNATAYGPSPRMRFDLVLNNLAGHAWVEHVVRMISDGSPWRPLVDLRDIAQAVACCLAAPAEDVCGEIFNVGDDEQNFRVREIARIVASVFPECETTFGPPSADNRSYRVSFAKIAARLPDFRCNHRIDTVAAELLRIFQIRRLDRETFESPLYTRLKQLERLLDDGKIDERFRWIGGPPEDGSRS